MTREQLWDEMVATPEYQESLKRYNAWLKSLWVSNEFEVLYETAADTRDATPEYKAWTDTQND